LDSELKGWLDSFGPAEELRTMEFTEEDWLIKDMLVAGSYMVVYGKEGAGKSRLMYQLAHCFQTGEPWFGLQIPQTGTVLYLEMDMSPLESGVLLRDAYEVGFTEDSNIIFPKRRGLLDVMKKPGIDALEELKERFEPLIVMIDTITDVYESLGKGENVNDEIKRVISPFRSIFEDSGNIFMLHERRLSQYLQSKDYKDKDAMLGGGETARKASSVIQIEKPSECIRDITIHKSRQRKPFEKLRVFTSEEERGFCHVDLKAVDNSRQALALWPHIKGLDPEEVEEATSIRAVCRSIESFSGGKLKEDTVKQAYYRAKKAGVTFLWERGDIDNFGKGDVTTGLQS